MSSNGNNNVVWLLGNEVVYNTDLLDNIWSLNGLRMLTFTLKLFPVGIQVNGTCRLSDSLLRERETERC